MVVPSNDFFIGNATPVQIFNANGSFVGPITIQVYGSDVWDSDTEQQATRSPSPSFKDKRLAPGRRSRTAAITPFLTEPGSASFPAKHRRPDHGRRLPYPHLISANDLIATIQISSVPEPASVALLGLGVAGMLVAGQRMRSRQAGRVE